MKREFSTSWIASKQPRKQRKYRANAPMHIRRKFLSAQLSKVLKEKYGKRSLPIRKGDEVLIMRGAFRKKTVKVESVDLKKSRVSLEGLQRSKMDGTKVAVFFDPSALQISSLHLEDRKRLSTLHRGEKKPDSTKKEEQKNVSEKTNDNN